MLVPPLGNSNAPEMDAGGAGIPGESNGRY